MREASRPLFCALYSLVRRSYRLGANPRRLRWPFSGRDARAFARLV